MLADALTDVDERDRIVSRLFSAVSRVSACVSQVQCTKADCGKWRQLSKETHLSAALASSYRCGMKLNSVKVSSASSHV